MSEKGTAPAPMYEVWELADDAVTDAQIAANALATLIQLVINERLTDPDTGRLDADAFAVFSEGIGASIQRAHDQMVEVCNIAHANQ